MWMVGVLRVVWKRSAAPGELAKATLTRRISAKFSENGVILRDSAADDAAAAASPAARVRR